MVLTAVHFERKDLNKWTKSASSEVNNVMMKTPPKLSKVKFGLSNDIVVLWSSLIMSLEKYLFLIISNVVLFSVTFRIALEK